MKLRFIFILFALVIFGCEKKSPNQVLFDRMYSFMLAGDYDIAMDYANNHSDDLKKPPSKADSVYSILVNSMYWLNKLNYSSIDDTLRLNRCISLYSDSNDDEKLAWALLLKSGKMYENQDLWNDGIFYLKQSEQIAKKLSCNELRYQIAFLKVNYDGHSANIPHKMALFDTLGKYSQRKSQKAFFYEMKSMLFSMIDQTDSAKSYQLKASELDTSSYWYNVCYILANADGPAAETQRRVNNVFAMNEQSEEAAYVQTLLYIKGGQIDKAMDFWETHKGGNDFFLIKCNNDFAEYHIIKGDYKKATEYYKANESLHKNAISTISDNQVELNSQKYDFEIQKLEQRSRNTRTVFVVIMLSVIVILSLSALLLFQKRRHEKLQSQNRQILKESQDKIEELRTADKTEENTKEINRLQKKITEIETRYADIYREGRALYDSIFSGDGNASQWDKRDYEKFIEYYKTLDLSLIAQIEEDYSGLNPRQMFFKILQAKGFDKDRIMAVLGIFTDGAYRALKSKVEARKK